MLYSLYPKIDYSVLDTMISITFGSVLRYKKIVKALKNLKKGLDRIGRIEKSISNTKEALRYILFMETPDKRPVLAKGEVFVINHALVNGILMACKRGKLFPYEAFLDLKSDDMVSPLFEINRQRDYIIDNDLICRGIDKVHLRK